MPALPVSGGTVESPGDDNSPSSKDERIRESESEPEEGEITDSQSENSYDEDSTTENKESSEDSEEEGMQGIIHSGHKKAKLLSDS